MSIKVLPLLPNTLYNLFASKLLFCNVKSLKNVLPAAFAFMGAEASDLSSKTPLFASRGFLFNEFTIRKSGFHLLTPSPWPIFSSFAAFLMLTGFAAYMNYYDGGLFCFYMGVFLVILAFLF